MQKLFIITALISSLVTNAQIITTFAGIGMPGSTGDGDYATLAKISTPHAIVIDKYGNFYFSQFHSGGVIRKIDTNGIISTIAGLGTVGVLGDGGPAIAASFKWPDALAFDTSGNLYIADHQNYRIRKIDMVTGVISTYAGSGVNGSSGDGGAATAAALFPACIIFDHNNNLYISDNTYHKIRKVNNAGVISTYAGTGLAGYSSDGTHATAAKLYGPSGIAIDKKGNLFFGDLNWRVRKIDANGIITTVAGNGVSLYNGDGIQATSAQLGAGAIAIDEKENIYLGDINSRIRMIDAFGIIHTIVGTGISGFNGDGIQATSAQIFNPYGIVFDACGNLFYSDITNNRIRKVTFNPPPCTYLSVNEQSVKKEISIYPNPTNEELHVNTSPGLSLGEVVLCNMVGQVVLSQQLNSNQTTLTVKHLPPGLYLLAITDEEGKRTVYKIVKE